jgi:phasin family protein
MIMSANNKQTKDFFKPFTELNVPMVDVGEMLGLCRRNIEACSAANQVIIEGVQAVSKRSAEVMQSNMEKCINASREVMSNGASETSAKKQSAVTKDVFETYVNSCREISEMISKSTFEAFDLLNKRCAEAMEEAGKLAKKAA